MWSIWLTRMSPPNPHILVSPLPPPWSISAHTHTHSLHGPSRRPRRRTRRCPFPAGPAYRQGRRQCRQAGRQAGNKQRETTSHSNVRQLASPPPPHPSPAEEREPTCSPRGGRRREGKRGIGVGRAFALTRARAHLVVGVRRRLGAAVGVGGDGQGRFEDGGDGRYDLEI